MSTRNCKYCGFECENPMTYCLCLCPYCGNNKKTCQCYQNSTSRQRRPLQKEIPNRKLLIYFEPLIENHIGKEWWRLEKWQIGRSKYP